MELHQAIQQIRAIEGVEFIPKRILPYLPKNAPACWGNCYPATEALYHMWGKDHGFKPVYVRYKLRKRGLPVLKVTHWFLVRYTRGTPDWGNYLDVTAAQFNPARTGLQLPNYREGTPCGFLTKKPSKRARKFIRGMKKAMAAAA